MMTNQSLMKGIPVVLKSVVVGVILFFVTLFLSEFRGNRGRGRATERK